MMVPGPRNLITDVAGLKVGNAHDSVVKSGTTVLLADTPMTAAVHVMGGAPGSRETDLLAPENVVQQVDALVLSGGSALGLSAASGVADVLRRDGRGFRVGAQNVPIVPAAILFDLANGGDKSWDQNPYFALGEQALAQADVTFGLGTCGAGTGATTAHLKGGLGSASIILPSGHTVGALVAVNALGSPTVGRAQHFWAAPFEIGSEFGGLGPAPEFDPSAHSPTKLDRAQNTTIAIVATDATLTQAQAKRVAIAAHDGMARALVPSHTPLDGDLVFSVATGQRPLSDPTADSLELGHAAACCLSRAIARAVYLATAAPDDSVPTWSQMFASHT